MELISGGVYWVLVPQHVGPPVLAQYYEDPDVEVRCWHYFGTDWTDRPDQVTVLAGPLDLPAPR